MHVPDAASHVETLPVHRVVFVVEHTPHAPLGWQAGVAPPHSASAVQAWHVCVPAVSQTGLAPEHCALAKHPTQVARGASQTDVAPTQREAFVPEHWPHAPPG